jgi:hypothetical protein
VLGKRTVIRAGIVAGATALLGGAGIVATAGSAHAAETVVTVQNDTQNPQPVNVIVTDANGTNLTPTPVPVAPDGKTGAVVVNSGEGKLTVRADMASTEVDAGTGPHCFKFDGNALNPC